jgi:hypothetical protein
MNKSVIQFVLTAITAQLVFGCTKESVSTSMSDDIDVHDDVAKQTSSIQLECPSNALVFFIGSSETPSKIDQWDILSPSRSEVEANDNESARKFEGAIQKAQNDLIASFAQDPKCRSPFELILASIIDGPGALDSSIETIHYGLKSKEDGAQKNWKKTGNKKWALKDGKLNEQDMSFELNMAKDVGSITQILAKNSFLAIRNEKTLKTNPDIFPAQIHYIIKTHGARVATESKYQPTLDNIKEFPRQNIDKSHWQSAIFMDTNGAVAPINPNVFSAHWNPSDISATMLGMTAGETNYDTAGDGASVHNTSGESVRDTAGDPGATSGGKSLSFQDALVDSSRTEYLGKRTLGSFATYSDRKNKAASIGEDSQLSFPVGHSHGASKNLIILDTCYASEKILNALEYAPGFSGKTVVLASVNELYYEFLDYSKLDLAGFLKLPTLLERLKKSDKLSAAEKELLANMAKGTLAWQNNETESAFKELTIWVD